MLQIYYPQGCPSSVGGYTNKCCPIKELGRIGTVVLFTDAFTSFATPTLIGEWTAGIIAGTIIPILDVRGESDGGEWTEEEGFGRKATSITAFTETITITDQNYVSNVANWNGIVKGNFRFAYFTETLCWMYSGEVSVRPTKPVSVDPKSAVYGVVQFKVVQSEMPVPFVYPQEVTRCFALQEAA